MASVLAEQRKKAKREAAYKKFRKEKGWEAPEDILGSTMKKTGIRLPAEAQSKPDRERRKKENYSGPIKSAPKNIRRRDTRMDKGYSWRPKRQLGDRYEAIRASDYQTSMSKQPKDPGI